MKKLAFKFIIFFALLFLVSKFLLDPYFKKFNTFEYSINEFYANRINTNYDILFIGSSHARNTYNTKIIDDIFNLKSFNLGSGDQRLIVTNYLLEDIFEETPPKLVVLEIFPGSLAFPNLPATKSNQLTVFDYSNLSRNKIEAISRIYDIREYPSVFSRTIRNHSKWFELKFKNIKFYPNSDKYVYHSGFIGTKRNLTPNQLTKYRNFKDNISPLDEKVIYSDTSNFSYEFRELEKTINICNDKGVKLLITSAPYLPSLYSPRYKKFHYLLKIKAKENGWDLIDFNDKIKQLGLETTDFMDPTHVNINGAIKVTKELCKFLNTEGYFQANNISLVDQINEEHINVKALDNNVDNSISNVSKIGLEHVFFENIKIEESSIYKDKEGRYIMFKVLDNFPKNDLSNLAFGVHLLFNEDDYDKRPKWMLGTDKDRETASLSPEFVEIDNEMYILLKMEHSVISKYKKLRIFLKNRGTFKGVIGNPLEVENIRFKN